MNFPVVFLSGIALINTVASLECFECDGEICYTEMKQWKKTDCDDVAPRYFHRWACLKETYKDSKTRQPAILRRCIQVQLLNGHDVRPYNCSEDRRDNASCYVCRTNLCNSAAILDAAAVATILAALLRHFLV